MFFYKFLINLLFSKNNSSLKRLKIIINRFNKFKLEILLIFYIFYILYFIKMIQSV